LSIFLKEEERALIQEGVPARPTTFIMSQAKESIELLDRALSSKGVRSKLTWERLRQPVTELSGEICSQAQYLEDDLKARKYLGKAAYALAGAGTIKLNVSVDIITTLGLLPWVTAWSGKLGAALWGRAAGLIPFPGDQPGHG
jgi:hypothetical protein